MAAVNRTAAAQADLEEIWDFIARNDTDSANAVLRQIARQADTYAENPELGSIFPGILPRLRYFQVGRYVAFFQADSDGILIVRVLHESRDLPRLLSGPT